MDNRTHSDSEAEVMADKPRSRRLHASIDTKAAATKECQDGVEGGKGATKLFKSRAVMVMMIVMDWSVVRENSGEATRQVTLH